MIPYLYGQVQNRQSVDTARQTAFAMKAALAALAPKVGLMAGKAMVESAAKAGWICVQGWR